MKKRRSTKATPGRVTRAERAQKAHRTASNLVRGYVIRQLDNQEIPEQIILDTQLQVFSAADAIMRGQSIAHHWKAIVDSVNIMKCASRSTERRDPLVEDGDGMIQAAACAIRRALDRRKQRGDSVALLDGAGVEPVRQVISAFPDLLLGLSYGEYIALLDETNAMLAIESRRPISDTVQIEAPA